MQYLNCMITHPFCYSEIKMLVGAIVFTFSGDTGNRNYFHFGMLTVLSDLVTVRHGTIRMDFFAVHHRSCILKFNRSSPGYPVVLEF